MTTWEKVVFGAGLTVVGFGWIVVAVVLWGVATMGLR